jgi:hypothetical protein
VAIELITKNEVPRKFADLLKGTYPILDLGHVLGKTFMILYLVNLYLLLAKYTSLLSCLTVVKWSTAFFSRLTIRDLLYLHIPERIMVCGT